MTLSATHNRVLDGMRAKPGRSWRMTELYALLPLTSIGLIHVVVSDLVEIGAIERTTHRKDGEPQRRWFEYTLPAAPATQPANAFPLE